MINTNKLHLYKSFIQSLRFTKVANSSILRISYFISKLSGRYMHWGKVESLSIEPTNLCNLKCPECPSGNNQMTRARLFLNNENFKKIIDETWKHLVYLQLYFQGEPFMHPKVTELIKYATQKNIFTTTSTNGHFLTSSNCEKIIDSRLQQIIVSIDGTTQNTFEKYRVGGSLDKVIQGIENLQAAKTEHNSKLPHIVIQFVVFSTNEHEIPDIKKLAKKLNVDDLRLKSAQIDEYHSGNELMPKNDKYNRYTKQKDGTFELKRKNNFKCFRIWNGAVVSADNELLPCCFDKDAKHNYAQLNQETIMSSWKNNQAIDFRKKIWKNYSQHEICRNCSEGLKKTWFKK